MIKKCVALIFGVFCVFALGACAVGEWGGTTVSKTTVRTVEHNGTTTHYHRVHKRYRYHHY